jgi:ribose 5-phosphate isomerase A
LYTDIQAEFTKKLKRLTPWQVISFVNFLSRLLAKYCNTFKFFYNRLSFLQNFYQTKKQDQLMTALTQDQLKRKAANSALDELKIAFSKKHSDDPFILGIGTGSTVKHFIDLLAAWLKDEGLKTGRADNRPDITLVSSSEQSSELLKSFGFEDDTAKGYAIDLYVDGADEANSNLQLIKGGGAALTGEKILVSKAKKFICIIDESKMVPYLGAFSLPIEVTKLAYEKSEIGREFIKLGGEPSLRMDKASQTPVVTDHGNYIYDVNFKKILNPDELYQKLQDISDGHILTIGLFLGKCAADLLIIAQKDGNIKKVENKSHSPSLA